MAERSVYGAEARRASRVTRLFQSFGQDAEQVGDQISNGGAVLGGEHACLAVKVERYVYGNVFSSDAGFHEYLRFVNQG